MSHALLSPSAAHRWLVCTPCARLEQGIEDQTSEYAEEGTHAHALAEALLTGCESPYEADISSYINYVEALKGNRYVEQKVDISPWVPECFGTADCIVVNENNLHIVDLKYGKGVKVSARENPQLRLYALGAINTLHLDGKISNIKTTIVQPRLENLSSESMAYQELIEWGETVKIKASLAYDGKGEQVAGEHCKFCKFLPQCRKYAEYAKAGIRTDLEPAHLLDFEVVEIIKKAPDIKKWLEAVEDYYTTQLQKGLVIDGLTLVKGCGRRVIDEKKLLRDYSLLEVGRVDTVTNIAKKIKNINDYVIYVEGKEHVKAI